MLFVFAVLYVGLIIVVINFEVPVWVGVPVCLLPYIFVLWTSQEKPYRTIYNFFVRNIQRFQPNTCLIGGVVVKRGMPLNLYTIDDARKIIEVLVIKINAKQSIADEKYRIPLISTQTGLTRNLNDFDCTTLRDIYIHLTGWDRYKYVHQIRPFSFVGV